MDASRPTFMASVLQWRHWPERFGRVMATHNYVPQIDGLRFLAIIQVVIYHAAVRAQRLSHPGLEASEGWVRFWPNGVAGVELFFFISGYIIAYPFVSGRKPTLRAFYMRRVTRLEPPYILTVLLCTLVYVAMFGTSLRSDGGSHVAAGGDVLSHTAASLVYAHGLIFQSSPPINPPLWTLEIEIQFYLVAPLLIGGFLMLKQGRVRTTGAFVAVVGAIALQALLDPIPAWHYSLVSHLFAFLFGVAASDWAVRAKPLEQAPAAWADALLLVGLTIFIASSAAFYWQSSFLDRMGLLVLLGLTSFLWCLGLSIFFEQLNWRFKERLNQILRSCRRREAAV